MQSIADPTSLKPSIYPAVEWVYIPLFQSPEMCIVYVKNSITLAKLCCHIIMHKSSVTVSYIHLGWLSCAPSQFLGFLVSL